MLKTLVDCKPSEFLKQTNKIRKSAEKWLTLTDIHSIRKRSPEFKVAPAGATAEERKQIILDNKELERKQVSENLQAILDEVLEKHPDETLEIIALCCFLEPSEIDNYPVSEYLGAITKMLGCKEVLDFFILLAKLGQTNI